MISIIVPIYNEENAVSESLQKLSAIAEKSFKEYEIIVVNDGSTDQTGERLKGLNIKRLSLINHVENLGYGKSLFDGILAAKYECIAITDADGSYPAERLKDLYAFYPQYDMIVGARQGKEYQKGLLKRPARLFFKLLVSYATGRKIPDINSGLRIFKKNIVLKFLDSLCTGFSFTTTITLLFMLNDYYVKYIPVDYYKRVGKTKVRHFKDTLRAAQIIVEAILYYNPIKLFLLFANINAAVGIAIGFLNYYFWKIDFLAIVAGICLASYLPIFCFGLLADQLKKIYKINKGS